jgi:DNA-binding MarR family transcriptional regulator
MSDEITLDKEVFKALAGDTRVSVLKSLLERRKTQSELAKELSLAAPTIKDHLDILQKAQLVREVDDGHKWKYIELTVKGKALLLPADKRIMVLLCTSLLGIAAAGFLAYSKFSTLVSQNVSTFSNETMLKSAALPSDALAAAADAASQNTDVIVQGSSAIAEGGTLASVAPDASVRAFDALAQTPSLMSPDAVLAFLPTPELAVLVICLVVFGLACGMWIKQTY